MSLLPHLEDAFRAARHDAARHWDGWHPDDDATCEDTETMPRRDCDCGACLVCAVERRTR